MNEHPLRMQAPRPVHALRRRLGKIVYRGLRRLKWHFGPGRWAVQQVPPLSCTVFTHRSLLLRPLKDVQMQLQYNKITNLRLAAERIDGLLIRPGETFSFWYRVGAPSARKGYLEGLVLESGKVGSGIGGGLCQMGNLLYWMALHSPLTVVERWRHSYDVFPDVNRTLPFGSGATLAYNYIDLQLKNETNQVFQLQVGLDETHLLGAILSDSSWPETYEVLERDHLFRQEPWGGYSRHNRLVRLVHSDAGTREEFVTENHALLMYRPFLGD